MHVCPDLAPPSPTLGRQSRPISPRQVFDLERSQCKRTCVGHRKGILSFAAVESTAVLVSGGLDRELLVWPYVGAGGGRPIALLKGHESSVVQVASNSHGC